MVTIADPEGVLRVREPESLSRLANRYPHLVVERDEATGGHIVRNPCIPDHVEGVTAIGSPCTYGPTFGIWWLSRRRARDRMRGAGRYRPRHYMGLRDCL